MNVLRLNPDGGAAPVVVDQPVSRVGRDSASDVHLRDASVSRQHAVIERRGEDWIIVDLNSGNGVRIDGKKIQEALLLPGQQLQIGNLGFRVEIDRGDDGATMMLGRSPLLEAGADRTLLAGAPPVFPPAEPVPSKPYMVPGVVAAVAVVLIGLGAVAYRTSKRAKPVPTATPTAPRPTPLPTSTPTPTPTATPTPPPPPRPTGTLLISTDIDTRVLIDGRVVADLKASGLRRFQVAPGEHIVQFRSDGAQTEVVTRVKVNEQTVVRRNVDSAIPPTPMPASPSPTSTPR